MVFPNIGVAKLGEFGTECGDQMRYIRSPSDCVKNRTVKLSGELNMEFMPVIELTSSFSDDNIVGFYFTRRLYELK